MKTKATTEFGDFQTPDALARAVCHVLADNGVRPSSIVEPTCGRGAFLAAAGQRFSQAQTIGFEINPAYVLDARARVTGADIREADFFTTDWTATLGSLPDPLLVIGNPPWVTNAALGALGSANLPMKTNAAGHGGLDALTGKSNFDISEWMLLRVLDWLNGRDATMAMLCKTSVARKLLVSAWRRNLAINRAEIHLLDAKAFFGAAVDACLLFCVFSPVGRPSHECTIFKGIGGTASNIIGFSDGHVIADLPAYTQWQHLAGESEIQWRSGIKHDCSSVMELTGDGRVFENGFGERVELEDTYVYPMLKTSELSRGRCRPTRWMLVPQSTTGEDTSRIASVAPKTWRYLQQYGDLLARRASRIYLKRPAFSIFGVGEYAFRPWKVAISGFYKTLDFQILGPHGGKPIVLDDLSYFLPCRSKAEAVHFANTLNGPPAQAFLRSQVFWDAKRPITIDLLKRLRLEALVHGLERPQRLFA